MLRKTRDRECGRQRFLFVTTVYLLGFFSELLSKVELMYFLRKKKKLYYALMYFSRKIPSGSA